MIVHVNSRERKSFETIVTQYSKDTKKHKTPSYGFEIVFEKSVLLQNWSDLHITEFRRQEFHTKGLFVVVVDPWTRCPVKS